ncbi:hypothetical protein NE865_05895 [Phthorimaea operculella]|nr:hypothetical protein NE865_05895 [Phthorimaea operculella]
MEEGEIVDELDDLSDISSEEEFLLRQRLEVLENYNNVLERKKAKNSSFGPGNRTEDMLLDLSDISTANLEDNFPNFNAKTCIVLRRTVNNERHTVRSHHKPKRRKDLEPNDLIKPKDSRKKVHRKKKPQLKVISESSEESEDEYRNKRRKLADAVSLNRRSNDKSSLQDRLQKMLGGKGQEPLKNTLTEEKQTETEIIHSVEDVSCSPILVDSPEHITEEAENDKNFTTTESISKGINEKQDLCLMIDLCADDDVAVISTNQTSVDTVDSVMKDNKVIKVSESDSEEDLEKLRQHALKSKAVKTKSEERNVTTVQPEKPLQQSEDEDSDTAELRLICLKSALLKKAIEMKQKQKLRKRMSQSSFSMQDDFLDEYNALGNSVDPGNNTDIESVDMDMGSDAEEKGKETSNNNTKPAHAIEWITNGPIENDETALEPKPKEDELEEDEDLLRAKLLTSLSKNLPKLVDPKVIPSLVDPQVTKATEVEKQRESTPPAPKTKVPENRIVINLGESDSEGEHEATKNLTKMHMKLSEQVDFQQKLDLFLKSTRMEVEKEKLPDDAVQNPVPKPPEKFVAKTVNHLPKSEQIEYKNLVKKMAELEKIKEARQNAMNMMNYPLAKDTLKPRNVSVDTTRIVALNMLEEQVAMSRKKIAEESARIMQLKEEGTKLIQKYKIVANELKNISTAITLNKKEQRSSQQRLSKIRLHHQRLLDSSINKHSKINGNALTATRLSNLQKENNPLKEDYKSTQNQKAVKVSVVNDRVEELAAPTRLSVQIDVTNNKKIVTTNADTGEKVNNKQESNENMEGANESDVRLPSIEKGEGPVRVVEDMSAGDTRIEKKNEFDDYKSPLQALERANWEADPNAIMCPFEVGGNCKDPDCKYLHPKVPSQ